MSFGGRIVRELLPIYAALERSSFVLQRDGVRYDSASLRCRVRRYEGRMELLLRGDEAEGGELISFGVTNGAAEHLESLVKCVLRYRAGLLMPIDIKEFTCRCAGHTVVLRCGVQRLPAGRLLSQSSVGGEALSEAVVALERGMTLRGVSFGELLEDAIIYGTDGKLYPFGYGTIEFEVSHDRIHEECEALRVRLGVSRGDSVDSEDLSDPYKSSLVDSYRGYLRCRAPHEDRIAVEGESGWGFIDSEGMVIVEPRYYWVSDFYEGRAEVCMSKGGRIEVIDRYGGYLSGAERDELLDGEDRAQVILGCGMRR